MPEKKVSQEEVFLMLGRLASKSESCEKNIHALQAESKELQEKLYRANIKIFALFAILIGFALLHPALKETVLPLLLGKFLP